MNERNGVLVYGLNYISPVLAMPAGIPWRGSFIVTNAGEYPGSGRGSGEYPGSILYVPQEHAGSVRMVDILRQSGTGNEDEVALPIVPEREFSAGQRYFLGLRNDEDERSHLRVYSLDIEKAVLDIRVQILVQAQHSWIIGHDQITRLGLKQRTSLWPYTVPLPVRPWATEILLDPLMEGTGFAGPYVILVSPVTVDARIWAFVSETHNHTQRIQLIYAQ